MPRLTARKDFMANCYGASSYLITVSKGVVANNAYVKSICTFGLPRMFSPTRKLPLCIMQAGQEELADTGLQIERIKC